jgi:hypothetical protein
MTKSWEEAYRSALLETDPGQLEGKIHSATVVLQRCLRELVPSQKTSEKQQILRERQQISDALRVLELIHRTELPIASIKDCQGLKM